MNVVRFRIEGINPEPWTAGTAFRRGPRGAGIAKNAQLRVYQEAIREQLEKLAVELGAPIDDDVEMWVYLWRRQESYVSDSGRRVTKHKADLTNMLKALEDALQPSKDGFAGIIKNDNQVRRTDVIVVEQGKDVDPAIEVVLMPYRDIRFTHQLEVTRNADGVGTAFSIHH